MLFTLSWYLRALSLVHPHSSNDLQCPGHTRTCLLRYTSLFRTWRASPELDTASDASGFHGSVSTFLKNCSKFVGDGPNCLVISSRTVIGMSLTSGRTTVMSLSGFLGFGGRFPPRGCSTHECGGGSVGVGGSGIGSCGYRLYWCWSWSHQPERRF